MVLQLCGNVCVNVSYVVCLGDFAYRIGRGVANVKNVFSTLRRFMYIIKYVYFGVMYILQSFVTIVYHVLGKILLLIYLQLLIVNCRSIFSK